MVTEPALRVRGLRKTFGATIAVEGLDLVVPRGAVYGVIGPSGAGKTTCIRLIMSILFPDAGELSVLGHRSALEAKDRIGYLPEERGVYRRMTVGAFLVYMAQLKGVSARAATVRVPKLLEALGLRDVERKRCDDLSKGMLQRIQFIGAILHEPDLLILDEPFSGLDPVSVRLLRQQIAAEQRRGATILLSTHVMSHAEALCQHVVMIHEGRKVLDEPMTSLRRQFDPLVVLFEPLHTAADVTPLSGIPGIRHIEPADDGYRVMLAEGTDPAETMAQIAAAVPVARLELSRLRLEDVFIRIVAGDTAGNDRARALRADLQAAGEGAFA